MKHSIPILSLVALSASLVACMAGGEDPTELDQGDIEDIDSVSQESAYNPGFSLPPGTTPLPPPRLCKWTQWYDRDNPGGVGDYEDRVSQIPAVCANPSAVECTTTGGVDWTQTGEVVTCTPSAGCYCVNANQPDGHCQDYIVRFCCP